MKFLIILLLVCLSGAIMISAESFWVDEATTAHYSQIASFRGFLYALWNERGSEAQMPLYMLSVWCWAQFVPASEWALRASNMVWLGTLFAGALYIARSPGFRLFPVLILVQPFLWRYVNELRPYAMQMSFAVWQMAALLDCYEDRHRQRRMLMWLLASWGVCASNMLGVVQTGMTAIVMIALYFRRREWPTSGEWGILFTGGVAFVLLGGYFLRTLMAGAGGSRLWTLSPANLGFALYEIIGLNGIGPSHLMLRSSAVIGGKAVVELLLPFIPMLLAFCIVMGGVILLGICRLKQQREMLGRVFLFGAMLIIGLAGIYILAAFVRWPFWGRHLASFFPTYVLLLTCLITPVWQYHRARFAVMIAVFFTVFSALSLRFSSRFAREDYRQAAHYATKRAASGEDVWWIAYKTAGVFYGLDFATNLPIRSLQDLPPEDLSACSPSTVMLSRADAFDPEGKVRAFLKEHKYVETPEGISGFTVWKKAEDDEARGE